MTADLELRAPGAPSLRAGSEVDLGTLEMTREEILEFAAKWDPLPIHADEEAAAAGPFGGLIASGLHTFVALGRLQVDHFMSVYPIVVGRGMREMRLPKPVRPGTVLRGTLRVDELRPLGDDRLDLVISVRATDPDGDVVMTMVAELIARR